MSSAVRIRAAAALNVSADLTAGEATTAFLAGLTQTDFVPEGNSVAALNTLAGLAIPVCSDSSPTLRDEVEEFAQRYWTMTPPDRLAIWLALSTRGPNDETAERLVTLQSGLEIPGSPLPNPEEERIAAIARLLYVLPPRERAIRRNVWLLANAVQHTELIEAADAIRKNHPTLVHLDSDLFERLGPRFNSGLFADTATTFPLPEAAYASPRPIIYPLPTHSKPPTKASNKPASSVYVILVCMGVMLLLAFKFGSNTSSSYDSSTKPRQVPSYQRYERETERTFKEMNRFSETWESHSVTVFTQSQVDAFEVYDRDRSTSAPPYYTDWVWAGKPKANEPYRKPQTSSVPGAFMSPPPEKVREK
jgi:hypothetical protein